MNHGRGDRWLYLITDFSYGEEAITAALRAGVDYIQLREKNVSSAEYLRRARKMRELSAAYQTKLIINDRVDIALLCGADGVHLGQEDIQVSDDRKLMGPDAVIGATAKTPQQAVLAQRQGADYLGSGAWFSTNTKKDAIPITKERYLEILRVTDIPNVAVGGITSGNSRIPLECGADGVAVSGGIMGAENTAEEVSRLRGMLNKETESD